MAPLRDRPYCFSHDPERAAEATEARRLGGLRRRKEGTIAVAYDLPGLDSVAGIRRLLDVVVTDGVGLANGIARLRVLISTAVAATNLLKVGELEDRLAHLEARRGSGRRHPRPAMTTERRLAKVEASLSPTQLVLRWLAEAHAHGDLESYIATLVASEAPQFPLDRLAKEAAEAARNKTRGRPRAEADKAIDAAVRGAVFRVLLALRINVVTHEVLEREVLT